MSRSLWMDNAKGVAIALVVIGHVIGGLFMREMFTDNAAWRSVYNWVYLFHMPVFFFVSGIFVFKSADKGLFRFMDGKVRRIVYPYFLWTFIQLGAIRAAGSGAKNNATFNDLLISVYKPFMTFWFLYALFVLMLLAAALTKAPQRRILTVMVGIAFYALHAAGLLTFWSVADRVGTFAIYFVIGAALGSDFPAWLQGRKHLFPILALPAFAAMTAIFLLADTSSPWIRPLAATLGALGTIGVAQAVSLFTKDKHSFVTTMGVYSLEIYLVHGIVVGLARIGLIKVTNAGEVLVVAFSLIGIVGSVVLAMIVKKLNLPYVFYMPSPKPKGTHTDDSKPVSAT